MEEKIVNILMSDIMAHPQQVEIYGKYEPDDIFEASIAEEGVLTPIIVTAAETFSTAACVASYVMISGHRRVYANEKAGRTEIPAIVRHYDSQEEANIHFLFCNQQRAKSEQVIINEFLSAKQELSRIEKLRKSKGLYAETIFENKDILSALKNFKIEPGDPLRTTDVIEEALGISEWKQREINYLFDDKIQEKEVEFIRNNYKSDERLIDGLWDLWMQAREAYQQKETSLRDAVDSIKSKLKEVKGRLKPLAKNKLPVIDKKNAKIDKKKLKEYLPGTPEAVRQFIESGNVKEKESYDSRDLEKILTSFLNYCHFTFKQ
jgi:ParB-like chromosome segregation protein Spo0J